MQPLISIIIPVWNVDCFLEKCLDSVVGQTYPNLQIILIDDGSPDASGKICDLYAQKDNRIEVIHQKNAGVCNARNNGMKLVRGRYVGFVDPDDWIAPDMFEYLYCGLEENNADISCCHYYRVTDSEEIYSQCDGQTYVYSSREAIEELVNRFIVRNVFWNKLFKTELFQNLEFPENRIYEGTAMIYKLFLKSERIVMLGDPKYYYINNPKSYINRETVKHLTDFVMAHVLRYEDLEADFPQLRVKMMKDLLTGVLKYRYLFAARESEIKESELDIAYIKNFLKKHESFLKQEMGLSKNEKRQLSEIMLFTTKAFRKARNIGAVNRRKEEVFQILKRADKNRKQVPPQGTYERPYYKQINQEILKKIQRCELDILKKTAEICEKNQIQYYLYGGTLLGAVRHRGFIPWDDDIDIVMPFKDYHRFLKIAQQELGGKYFCQTCLNDNEYPKLFAKIRREDSYILEDKWIDKNMHAGIYIDIMPLVGFPDNKFLQKSLLHLVSLLNQVCSFDKAITRRKITKVCFRILKKFPLKMRYKMRENALQLSNRMGGKKWVCSYGSHYMPVTRRVLCKSWFTGTEKMQFEDTFFYVPCGWKEYLEYLYGASYMELPPEDKRETHLNLTKTVFPEEMREENETL